MAHTNTWEEKGLYRAFTGTTSGAEVIDSNLSIHGDPRFDKINYVLNDFSTIDSFDVSDIDISLIANIDKAATISKPILKIAIVTRCSDLLKWVEKYLQRMDNSTYTCNTFDNLEDARDWCEQ